MLCPPQAVKSHLGSPNFEKWSGKNTGRKEIQSQPNQTMKVTPRYRKRSQKNTSGKEIQSQPNQMMMVTLSYQKRSRKNTGLKEIQSQWNRRITVTPSCRKRSRKNTSLKEGTQSQPNQRLMMKPLVANRFSIFLIKTKYSFRKFLSNYVKMCWFISNFVSWNVRSTGSTTSILKELIICSWLT